MRFEIFKEKGKEKVTFFRLISGERLKSMNRTPAKGLRDSDPVLQFSVDQGITWTTLIAVTLMGLRRNGNYWGNTLEMPTELLEWS